jgi:hypothetical protein
LKNAVFQIQKEIKKFIELKQAFLFVDFRFFGKNLRILENRKCFKETFKNDQVLAPAKTSISIKNVFFHFVELHFFIQLS